MQRINLLLCFSILLGACDDDSIDTGLDTNLPLQVGNYWKFVPTSGTGTGYTFRKVNAKVDIGAHTYYEVVSGYANPDEVVNDTLYYRIDNDGFVYTFRKGEATEENIFRLEGKDGDAWSYSIGSSTVNISLSVLSLDIADKELKDCKAYYRDVDIMADEEYTITLAKGIGFVKLYSDAWSNGSILKSAVINGVQINL